MFKPVPVAIGLRYLRAKRRNGFISFISLASILGIAIGVMVLITTLAVMSGFQREIKDRMLGMVAHATVSADGEPMTGWPHAVEVAMRDPRVAGAAPYIDAEALLRGARQEPAAIRGVSPDNEAQVSDLAQWMVQGSLSDLEPGAFNIVLGKELAQWLGARVGDKIVGIFEAGYQDFDRRLAVVNVEDAQRLMRMGEGVTGVRLKLHDMDQAWNVAADLAQALAAESRSYYRVSDWSMENANMFRALKLEKTMIGILLSLIILMGAFSLLSSQVMLVTDKLADIAILRTLGLTPGAVMQVFVVQGTLIGLIGTITGVIGGLVLTFNLEHILRLIERAFNVVLMPQDVYYVTGLPIDLQGGDVVVIACVAMAMAFLATIYPAWRAARTAPAEALRYE